MTLDFEKMNQAVNSETNAGGFANLMKNFMKLGVTRYDYLVAEGMYRFYDVDSSVDLQMNGVPKNVAEVGDPVAIKAAVRQAQAGAIVFEQFCELAGQAGVPVWTSDLVAKHVTYFDGNGKELLVEAIPGL
ncbi:DUF1398 domain-containing protein [Periweissella cryptocerci]|uniref:DUF1398 domain-containing protein n=1 Tax=Periweissella cryptocerci TaxID=2506420 RepID=A0A4V1AIS6_9LACO|nr:DUF1398 family protein [Periweissella cryptocerci]QBO36535.1 DUF1398 domain-containing protein [Periweissella cryptocerci]